jgi:hypothetical protein
MAIIPPNPFIILPPSLLIFKIYTYLH